MTTVILKHFGQQVLWRVLPKIDLVSKIFFELEEPGASEAHKTEILK